MTFLVYWYGFEPKEAYSFLPPKQFKMYNEGLAMNLGTLPTKIQKKVDSGKTLTKKENDLVRGLEEMRADLAKAPEERTKGECKELHEIDECVMIMGTEGVDYELLSDGSEEEQEEQDSGESRKAEEAKKVMQPDKSGVDEIDFAEDEISSNDQFALRQG